MASVPEQAHRLGRHGHDRVVREQLDDPVDVDCLPGRDEPRDGSRLGVGGRRERDRARGGLRHARARAWPRARWSALFTDATLSSRRSATSRADQPSTSRRTRTARCRGGRNCIDAHEREADRLALLDREVGLEQMIGIRLEGRGDLGFVEVESLRRARTPFESSQARVRRDPIEPGAERSPVLVPIESAPRPHEGVLEDIVGIVERTEHPIAVHVERTAMRLHEARERRSRLHSALLRAAPPRRPA